MLRPCKIFVKETGEIFYGQIDTNLEHLDSYPYRQATEAEILNFENNNNQLAINQEARQFLTDTDWKVIRHRDQIALGIETSLTSEEFQQLLSDRQQARDKVMELT